MAGPYLSVAELLDASTGVDWSSIPRKNAPTSERDAEMLRIIRRATSQMNGYTGQKLWATQDVEIFDFPGRWATYRQSDGAIIVFPKFYPVIAVDSVQFGTDGANWNTIQGTVVIPNQSGDSVPQEFWIVNNGIWPDMYGYDTGMLRITYRDGYPNAKLSANALIHATQIVVDDPIGFRAGDTATIYDDTDQEDVVIASTYVAGSATIPLTAGLQYAHAAGVTITEMAERIREAAIKWSVDIARLRGRDTITIGSGGTARVIQAQPRSKIDEAKEDLEPHVRRR